MSMKNRSYLTYYDDSNSASYDGYYMVDEDEWLAERFDSSDITEDCKLTKVSVHVRDVNDAATDPLIVELQTDSSNLPSGTALTNESIPASSIGDSAGWFDVTFSDPATLSSGGLYWLILKNFGTTEEYTWTGDDTSPTYPGLNAYSTDLGSSWTESGGSYDWIFRAYANYTRGSRPQTTFNVSIQLATDEADYLTYRLYDFGDNISDIMDIFSDMATVLGSSKGDDRYHLENGSDDLLENIGPSWENFRASTGNYTLIYDNSTENDQVDNNVIALIRFNESSGVSFEDTGLKNLSDSSDIRIRYNVSNTGSSDEIEFILVNTMGDWSTVDRWINTIYSGSYPDPNFLTAPPVPYFESHGVIPEITKYNQNITISAVVQDHDNNLVSVNFTLTSPDGTKVIDNENGSFRSGNEWNSSYQKLDRHGQWNYSIFAIDSEGNNNTVTGTINFLHVASNITPNSLQAEENFTIYGHINDSHGNNVVNHEIFIYENGTLTPPIDGWNFENWWDTNWRYRRNISVNPGISTDLTNTIIRINFSTSNLISDNRINSDCSDVRFTDSDGNELDYTLETSTCNSGDTAFWVWANLTGNTNNTLYVYYGNIDASLKTGYSNTDEDLILYYHFDNSSAYGESSSNIYDFSKYGNNGTATSTTWVESGKFGGAHEFDGQNGDISVADAPEWDLKKNFTIMVWVYPDGFFDDEHGIFRSNEYSYNLIIQSSTRKFRFELYDGSAYQCFADDSLDSYNRWYHLTAVYDGSNQLLYVDGSLNGSCPYTGEPNDVTTGLKIGYQTGGTYGRRWDGKIDELRIYNRSLSSDEISAIYNQTRLYFFENKTVTETDSQGDYNYTFLSPSYPGQYEIKVNTTYNSEYGESHQNLTVISTLPWISSQYIYPSSAYTDDNLSCNATPSDSDNATGLTIEYRWLNCTSQPCTEEIADNLTGLNSGEETVVTTFGFGNTTKGEKWNCSVRAFDGKNYSDWQSDQVTIQNKPPTHDNPHISPSNAYNSSNITCNWNNISDADSDKVTNITKWYKDDKSINTLYLPFEGGSDSSQTPDYSGYNHDGSISGANWNQSEGKIGSAYNLNGDGSYIKVNPTQYLNLSSEMTYETWAYLDTGSCTEFTTLFSFDERRWGWVCWNGFSSGDSAFLVNGANVEIGDDNEADYVNAWHHYVFVYENSECRFYLDGNLKNSTSCSEPTRSSTKELIIGNNYNAGSITSTDAWIGKIDEFRVYNYSLSVNQIRSNYELGSLNKTPNKIIFDETRIGENWKCEVTPNDGVEDGQTKNSTGVQIVSSTNQAPSVSEPTFSPTTAYTTDDIDCNATPTDAENSTLSAEYFWYNSTGDVIVSGNKTGLNNGSNAIISTLSSGDTSKDTYNCSVRTFDGELYSGWDSAEITIQNSPPTINLLTPTNANISIRQRTPEFTWSGSDDDGDTLNYTIWLSENSDLSSPNITAQTQDQNYTPTSDLELDTQYFWKVEAYDSESRTNSSTWNFTTESYIEVKFINESISFGSMNLSQTKNTTSDDPYPFVLQNMGNVLVNVTFGVTGAFWDSALAPLDTRFLQFKADERTEANSFDYAQSQTTWMNLSTENKTLVKDLNYTDSNDEVVVDILIRVPEDEPAGSKSTNFVVEIQ